ncbi:desert hedgehog protein [Folsomia candida]|uniref:Desert hedgehog protein n=1 Tax=Folsomia candida TaxID=158441 RepID=A0A226D5L3_FOLCA|nr:desert hedgehog protein [Folsomia candida]OXA40360.1 Desert hedgehog protein [Folsomia candida]
MSCCCFPGDVLVTMKSGGVKRMDKLIRGEEILTLSKAGGVPKYTQFYTWIHREVDRETEFVVITTSTGKMLKITGDHLLFGEGRVAKRAGMVKEGDKLCMISGKRLVEEVVVDVSMEIQIGVYAPFTMSGDFIANGFLVACYSDIDNFDVAHASMLPLRMFHKLDKSWKKGNKNQEGLHIYARNLMKIWENLPPRVQTAIQN